MVFSKRDVSYESQSEKLLTVELCVDVFPRSKMYRKELIICYGNNNFLISYLRLPNIDFCVCWYRSKNLGLNIQEWKYFFLRNYSVIFIKIKFAGISRYMSNNVIIAEIPFNHIDMLLLLIKGIKKSKLNYEEKKESDWSLRKATAAVKKEKRVFFLIFHLNELNLH